MGMYLKAHAQHKQPNTRQVTCLYKYQTGRQWILVSKTSMNTTQQLVINKLENALQRHSDQTMINLPPCLIKTAMQLITSECQLFTRLARSEFKMLGCLVKCPLVNSCTRENGPKNQPFTPTTCPVEEMPVEMDSRFKTTSQSGKVEAELWPKRKPVIFLESYTHYTFYMSNIGQTQDKIRRDLHKTVSSTGGCKHCGVSEWSQQHNGDKTLQNRLCCNVCFVELR